MKQTNNAIKFLMAQYRAIFKHANIAMVAAMAAAALAAGQAQATGDFDSAAAGNSATNVDVTIDGTGSTDKTYAKLNLLNDSKSDKAYDIKVQKGGDQNKIKGAVTLANSKLTISGANTTEALVTIEAGAVATTVKLKEIAVSEQGKLAVTGAGDKKTNVTAEKLSFGNGKDATNSVVTIGEHSTVTASGDGVDTGTLTINKATVTVSGGGTLTGKLITLTDGTVNLGGGTGAGTLGAADSAVKLDGGTLAIAGGASGSLTGSSIDVGNATIDNKGTLNVTGAVTAKNGAKVTNTEALAFNDKFTAQSGSTVTNSTKSKTITFKKGAAFEAGSAISNSGTIVLQGDTTIDTDKITTNGDSILKIDNVTATMSTAVLGKFIEKGKVQSNTGNTPATIALTDEKVELGDKGIKLLTDSNGQLNSAKYDLNSGLFEIKSATDATATFGGSGDLNAKINLDFAKLELGKDGNLNLKGGSQVQVGKSLTVNGGADKGTGITVESGSLILDGSAGVVSAKAIILNNNDAKLLVKSGKWQTPTVTLTNGSGSVTGAELAVSGDLTVTKGALSLNDGANLKVTGNISTVGSAGKITASQSVIDTVGGGTVTLGSNGGAGVELKNTSELKLESKDFLKDNALDTSKFTGAITGDSNTTITFDGGNLELDKAKFDDLANKVGDNFKGLFNVKLTGVTNAEDGMQLGAVANKVTSEAYEKVSVKQDSAKDVVQTNKSVGSVELTGGNKLSMGENTSLTISNAKNGKFVYQTTDSGTATTGSVVFKNSGNSLTLAGTGEIGSITVDATAATANAGTVTIGKANKTGAVTVKGNIGDVAQNSRVLGVTVNDNSSLKANNVYTTKLDLSQGSSMTTAADGVVDVSAAATIMGNVDAGTLKLGATSTIAGNASVDVGTLDLAGSQTLTIGKDGDENGKGSSSAAVFADKFIMGAGSTLFVDPAYTEKASILAVQTIQGDVAGTDVGIAQGNIVVGKNAAFGYGFDQAGFESVMADYLVDGKFVDPKKNIGGVANAFVLNKPLTVNSGNYVVVDASLEALPTTGTPNSLTLGKNSALIVTESAFEGGKAALTFGKVAANNGQTVSDAKVIATDGAKISLVGTFTAKSKDIKIFEAAQGTSGGGQVAVSGQAITVEALGGLLSGTLAVGANSGTLGELKLSDNAETLAYDGVARPVGDMLLGIAKAEFDTVDNSVGYKFVTTTMGLPGGYKAIDAAAHAATYAGAQQAAVASVTTMADAMFGRVGAVGVEAASISATGSQTKGGVWLTPMYKSVDADGFNAEGASYGADVDLAGVAFGTDTVNGNMRFGAVFNIGSGDADGKGNGNGLKDEFDYYGFGVYSAMGFGNLALIGDASMTVISHEVEGLGLKGEADTTAVTMGLTGQYTVSTPAVDVTPHLGARFIRLNTDSYDLVGEKGVVANTEFDVQNVFSIPVGVTLSKAFVTGGWSLAPSADLTVAFNTGDTEAKSNTRFTGINKNIGLNTEVLDEVTYGLTVGLGAQYGAFGTSFGINYTGSENTDSFGVNAQARYMF